MTSLGRLSLIPVVEIPDAAAAVPLGRALAAAGLPCAEITFRTAAAPDAIRLLRLGCPEVLVGAGTVLTVEDADTAIGAGAAFLVAPGFNPQVVRHALERGVPMIPGVCTPSDIEAALAHGISVVKFFPAEVSGGVAFLKAVSAPYRAVRFIPTGGIGPGNLGEYLALPQVLACGGSWMVRPDVIANGDFDAIRRATADAVKLARSSRPASTAAVGA